MRNLRSLLGEAISLAVHFTAAVGIPHYVRNDISPSVISTGVKRGNIIQ